MGTFLVRNASSFFQAKYKSARLALTDVSEAELLVAKVTDDNPWCPDTKSMTQIAEASYDHFDDYWRVVDLLHKRLSDFNRKKWRRSYNSLILLEFLITHGPEDFAIEFRSDVDIIKELGTFRYTDKEGVNWGLYMRNKTERILNFIQGGASLQEVRSKAIIKLTNEIQGFGSSSSSTSSSSSSPTHSWRSSSFDNNSPSSPTWHHDHHHHHPSHDHIKHGDHMKQLDLEENLLEPNNCPKNDEVIFQHNRMPKNFLDDGVTTSDILDWNSFQETFIEIDLNDDFEDHDNNNDKKKVGFFKGICSKHVGYKPIE